MCWSLSYPVPKITHRKKIENPGLPVQGEPGFLSIGILRKPHGIKGEIKMEVWTDFPERIKDGKEVFIGERKEKFTVKSFRRINDGFLIFLNGIETTEIINQWIKKIVYVNSKDLPHLDDRHFYHHQVIGLDVFTTKGVHLGKIVEIIRTGSNDVYVIQNKEQNTADLLIPAISSVILNVSLKDNRIIINPPQWG
jgi:16S rRNA processing protein RimM